MFHGKQFGSCVSVYDFVSSRQQLSVPLTICCQLQLVRVMVWYTSEQRVFLHDTYVKYGSAGKCGQKFRDQIVPSRQTIHTLVSKLRTRNS
jgi:hypothetical protein